MINAVGREIPEEVLKATGKDIFKGAYVNAGVEYQKGAPKAVQEAVDFLVAEANLI